MDHLTATKREQVPRPPSERRNKRQCISLQKLAKQQLSATFDPEGNLTPPSSPPDSPPNQPADPSDDLQEMIHDCSEDSDNASEDATEAEVSSLLNLLATQRPSAVLMASSHAIIRQQRDTIACLTETTLVNEIRIHNLDNMSSLDATRIQSLSKNNNDLARANAKLRTSLAKAEQDLETLVTGNLRLVEDYEILSGYAEEMEGRFTEKLNAAEGREWALQECNEDAEEEAKALRGRIKQLEDTEKRTVEKLEILKQGLETFESLVKCSCVSLECASCI